VKPEALNRHACSRPPNAFFPAVFLGVFVSWWFILPSSLDSISHFEQQNIQMEQARYGQVAYTGIYTPDVTPSRRGANAATVESADQAPDTFMP